MRKQVSNTDTRRFRADTGHLLSTPIPLPVAQPNNSPGRELYYRQGTFADLALTINLKTFICWYVE